MIRITIEINEWSLRDILAGKETALSVGGIKIERVGKEGKDGK